MLLLFVYQRLARGSMAYAVCRHFRPECAAKSEVITDDGRREKLASPDFPLVTLLNPTGVWLPHIWFRTVTATAIRQFITARRGVLVIPTTKVPNTYTSTGSGTSSILFTFFVHRVVLSRSDISSKTLL